MGEITSPNMYVDTILESIEEAEQNLKNIKVTYLMSVNRCYPDSAKNTVDLLEKYKGNPRVVGLELSGDPRSGDFSNFVSEFNRAREMGFKISLHCGETKEQIEECQ